MTALGGSPGATLALDLANGGAKLLPNGGAAYAAWTRRQSPKALAVSGASLADVAAMAAAPDGATLVSCAKAGGALTKWTLSATGLTADATTLATGLDAVSSVAVYAVGKPGKAQAAYAVVGEANGDAATAGQVKVVNLATGAAATLLSDAEGLGGGIASVRMSRTDTSRPRLYVLTAAGDLHCYYLDEGLSTATATCSCANATLLGLAKAPFAAGAARVTAFDVSPDGGTLALGYAATGGAAAADEAMAIAVIRHAPRAWTYTEEDGLMYISDGSWKLRCYEKSGSLVIGTAAWGGSSGCGYANDYVGEFLDLSAGQATNAVAGGWKKIIGHRTNALGGSSAHGTPRVILFSPKTGNVDGYQQFMKDWTSVEEVVIASSEITRFDAWAGWGTALRRIAFDLPKLATIEKNSFCGNASDWAGEDTEAAQWNLPALKTIGDNNFTYTDLAGVLSLPAVETIGGAVLYECHYLTEVRLGAEAKSVKAIGNTFLGVTDRGGDRAVGRLKKVVIGGVAAGFTVEKEAFLNQPLEEVVFTGGVPAFADGFAFPDTAARTVFFVVPRGDANWAAALAGQVTAITETERRAIQKAHPDRPMPFGVVAKDVFRTANEQYVCWADAATRCAVTIEHDTFFGDAVEVTSDLAPGSDGTYPVGTTLTLTPKASKTGAFAKWYGDVPGGASTASPLSLVVTGDTWVFARFTHPWTLTRRTGETDRMYASNGNFTLNCKVRSASDRKLGLGDERTSDGVRTLYADIDEGEGVLDLGGEVRLAGDATPWRFTEWQGWAYNGSPLTRTKHGKGNVSTLVLTDDMGIPGGGTPFGVDGGGEASFRTVIIDMPARSDSLRHWIWGGAQTKLTRLVLQSPNLHFSAFGGQEPAFRGTPLAETKFGWWDLSGLTSLSSNAWSTGGSAHVSASGTLRLPSLCTVRGNSLGHLPNVEAIALGGLNKKTVVTAIEEGAFAQDPKLKALTLHNGPDMTVGATPFAGGATPAEITLTGKAIDDGGAAFAALLAGVEAAETKPVVVYASWKQGWDDLSYIDRELTDAERAQAPEGATALGVYRGGSEKPLGKALVIHRASPYDPKGAAVFIR